MWISGTVETSAHIRGSIREGKGDLTHSHGLIWFISRRHRLNTVDTKNPAWP